MFVKEELTKYIANRPKSKSMWERSINALAGGVSHNIRNLGLPLIGAYPPFIQKAESSKVTDIDGISYLDFWGAHYAMVTGYSNEVIRSKITQQLSNGWHLGTVIDEQVRLAELLIQDNPSVEQVRFCTSGTEATMYATRLARAFTGKKKVAKAKFGWHGAADTLFYNVRAPLTGKETRGIVNEEKAGIISIDINDPDVVNVLKDNSDELAAVIVEPVLGGGGGFPVDREFLRMLREETEKDDILLIFDEVITGYRFSYGLYQNEIGVQPDLTTMGKIIGGGFPIGAIGGRRDVIEQANPTLSDRVWIGGGTFSGYPLSMLAGIEMLSILRKSKSDYERINTLGSNLLESLNSFFRNNQLHFIATGHKSLVTLHPLTDFLESNTPTDIVHHTDKKKESLTQLALLNRNITGMHGLGALSFAHIKEDMSFVQQTLEEIAPHISKLDSN
ncbi:MAG: aspartate aminotransferase family protein [Candidatus Hodarchaeales archaeon]